MQTAPELVEEPTPAPIRLPRFAYAAAVVRAHPVFTAVFAVGFVLRVLTQVTYWPSIQFPDSLSYTDNAAILGLRIWHPVGYPVFLWLFKWTGELWPVTILQHLIGLAGGVLIYLLLRRLGAGGWAVLGAAPMLLDPMQIYLEQYVLADVLFMFLVVVILVVGVLRPITRRLAVVLGLLVAYATMVRTIAVVIAVPLALYWLWQKVRWRTVLAGSVAAIFPLLVYAAAFDAANGAFSMQGYSGRWLYGRVAPIADCRIDHVPASTRQFCPTQPPATRELPSEWVWNARSPYNALTPPQNQVVRSQLAASFAHAVLLHQPAAYLSMVARDIAHAFAPSRDAGTRGWFTGSWRFYQPGQPTFWRTSVDTRAYWPSQVIHATVLRGPARFLHDYERYVFTPGPLGLIGLIACVLAAVSHRRRQDGAVAALLAAAGVLLLVVPIATVDLDYRYVLSAQELIVAGGALGLAMLVRRVHLETAAHHLWPRRALVAGGVVMTVGLAVGNVTAFEAYADGVPSPRPVPLATTVDIGHRLLVTVDSVDVVGARCLSNQWHLVYQFSMRARGRTGPPVLGAGDDFFTVEGNPLRPYWVTMPLHGQFVLRPYLVSRRYPSTAGTFDMVLPFDAGVLVYTDPLGAGAARWTFSAPPTAAAFPTVGSLCTATEPT